METCYNIVDMDARSEGLWGLRPLDMAEVVMMVIILIGNSVLKRLFIILKWSMLHLQSHAGRVVTSLGNRSITHVHTVQLVKGLLHDLKCDVLSHTEYSLELAPSDFHLFCLFEQNLWGQWVFFLIDLFVILSISLSGVDTSVQDAATQQLMYSQQPATSAGLATYCCYRWATEEPGCSTKCKENLYIKKKW